MALDNVEHYIYFNDNNFPKKVILEKAKNNISEELYSFLDFQLFDPINFKFEVLHSDDMTIYIERKTNYITIATFSDNDARFLKINEKDSSYDFQYNYENYSNEYEAINELMSDIINHSKGINKLLIDIPLIYFYLGYSCPFTERVVLESDILRLTEFSTYTVDNPKRTYRIVLNSNNKIIGNISFMLKSYSDYIKDENITNDEFDNPNFSYIGNVKYKINEEYQNHGYATEALRILILQIEKYGEEYAKELFISTEENEIAAQQVALINGAKMIFDGEIPAKSLSFNVKNNSKRKIYKI